jgi:hypothetical protein
MLGSATHTPAKHPSATVIFKLLPLLLRRACAVLLLQVQRTAVCFDVIIESG